MVLLVSEVCAGRYGVGRAREGCTRGEERLVGRSSSGAPVGMAEENPLGAENRAAIQPLYDHKLNLVRVLSAYSVQKPLFNSRP